MPRCLAFVLFLLVAISILEAGHCYYWVRFVRDVRLPLWGRKLGTVLAVVLMLPMNMIATRTFQSNSLRAASMVGNTWIGAAMMLVVSQGLLDVSQLTAWLVQRLDRDGNANRAENQPPAPRLTALPVPAATLEAAISAIAAKRGTLSVTARP